MLKLQLNEARQKTNDKKQKTKPDVGKVMVAAEQQPPVPDAYTIAELRDGGISEGQSRDARMGI